MKLNTPLDKAFGSANDTQIVNGIVTYLKKVEPRAVFDRPRNELESLAWDSLASARSLGVTQRGAFNKYAYLWGLTDGLIAQTKEATDFIQFGGVNPNEQVQHLLQQTADALQTDAPKDGTP